MTLCPYRSHFDIITENNPCWVAACESGTRNKVGKREPGIRSGFLESRRRRTGASKHHSAFTADSQTTGEQWIAQPVQSAELTRAAANQMRAALRLVCVAGTAELGRRLPR